LQQDDQRFGGLVAVQELDIEVQEKSIHSIIGLGRLFNCVTGFYKAEEGRSSTAIPWWASCTRSSAWDHPHLSEYPPLPRTHGDGERWSAPRHERWTHCRDSGTRKEEKEAEEAENFRFVNLAGKAISTRISGDQRRLVAWALATCPQLLLLDEPTAGMNPKETQEMMDSSATVDELGITILLIEHQMGGDGDIRNRDRFGLREEDRRREPGGNTEQSVVIEATGGWPAQALGHPGDRAHSFLLWSYPCPERCFWSGKRGKS
jgi:hypothetical protein